VIRLMSNPTLHKRMTHSESVQREQSMGWAWFLTRNGVVIRKAPWGLSIWKTLRTARYVLEDLFGDDDVEFLVKHAGADVVPDNLRKHSGQSQGLSFDAADFQRGAVPEIQLANQTRHFLVHDNAKPILVVVEMQLCPAELIGFLNTRNGLEL
jgi:hypothetical protein